ncbi:MAG: Gfo/Idh/MocA family oxidoreductase [Dehalococcoidia bacterium]|nr:MAG: Gfo/Idh/MocA family oxidoreductase [Dehalococcoidia bacterium]
MSPLRVGLIGCGFIGRFHSRALRGLIRRGLVDAEYAAVCDVVEERTRSFADIAGVPIVTADPTEVIDSPDIDVVYICVPTAGHKELVLRAAQRGKHIFCEKPLATSLADVEEMVAAVAGVKAGVGLVLRHSPVYTVLRSLAEDPRLGRLMAIIFRDDQFFPIQGHYQSEWRKDHRQVGSGTLLEHSIHDVDILRWFGGEVRALRGTVRNFAGHARVEDLAIGHLEFVQGTQAELISVWHNVLGRPSTRRLELFFENGLFTTDHDFFGPIQLQIGADPPRTISEEEVRRRYLELIGLRGEVYEDVLSRYTLEDYFFLKALTEGAAPFPDFGLALEAHRLVDAIYRSSAAGGEAVVLA